MTDREKLAEIISGTKEIVTYGGGKELFALTLNKKLLDAVVDNLIANGVTVMPCKVGDKVWIINRHMNAVFENTVISLHCGHSSDLKNYIKTKWTGSKGNESIRKWHFRQIGRYVFYSREEAEAALKEE